MTDTAATLCAAAYLQHELILVAIGVPLDVGLPCTNKDGAQELASADFPAEPPFHGAAGYLAAPMHSVRCSKPSY